MRVKFIKKNLFVAILLFCSATAIAQSFTSHAVKEGETLESIAEMHNIDPSSILEYNKEIKMGDALKANTLLVIPINKKDAEVSNRLTKLKERLSQKDSIEAEKTPIGFITHKTRKRETLFGLGQRYLVSEDEIKRYNTELYAMQLKKGMTLKIPRYKRVAPEDNLIKEENFEIYTVLPKETRWSVAHKYGITIDSMLVLNPDLSNTTDYLGEGQELLLPKPLGSSIENQETRLYTSYTVPSQMTFYSLKEDFGVEKDEVIKLNPEVKESGLQEGMVIRLPVQTKNEEEVNTDNFIFYEVKPGEAEYSLTRKLGMSYRELIDLNPDLSEGLKAGMVLKLPKDSTGDFEIKNALILDKINLLDSINPVNRPVVLFMLPFRLDRINLSDTEIAVKTIENRNDIKFSAGLYSGALIALDSIKKLGISAEIRTYDTQKNIEKVREILFKENLRDVNAIVGPLDNKLLQEVAVRASRQQVPVIAPIASKNALSLNNVFFPVPSSTVLRKQMLSYVAEKRTEENIIIIADSISKPSEASILNSFPEAHVLTLLKNRTVDLEKLEAVMSLEKENWVFVETVQSNVVNHISSVLNSSISEEVKVRMFTTNRNRAFENDIVSNVHLSNLNFTFPSNQKSIGYNKFVQLYRQKFKGEPDKYAVIGFDLMYDLLLKLAYKNNLFEVSKLVGSTEYTANKFDYSKDTVSGYFNNAFFIMEYKDMQLKEVDP